MKNNQIIFGLVLLAVACLSFFGGMQYQKSKRSVFTAGSMRGQFIQNNQNGSGNRMMGNFRSGGQIVGEVLSVDNQSITVKLPDGSSKILILSGNTQVMTSTTASISAVTLGSKIAVFGQTNPDGSVSVQNIQIR